ncbi:MAG: vitamin-B12 independent methionine synthase [Gemmataceae bacterium]
MFPVTMVGSWPRPVELLRARKRLRAGQLDAAAFDQLADQAVRAVLDIQHQVGVDIVTDGEQRRDNFYSFVADKLDGVQLMTLAEMLDIVEDKVGFEKILQTLDVPAYSLSNPTCVGRLERRRPLAVEELRFLKQHTDRAIKIPLPGPYLLTRAMFVPEVTRQFYPNKEALAVDVIRILREEVRDLITEGVDFIQFDEPVLTEVAFNPKGTRTFMCASLAARGDPKEELEFAVSLLNQVLEGITGPITGLHICRGNWSQNESILLRGSYHPLAPYLERINVRQLVLEYATERAGDILRFGDKALGLGVVNPRTEAVESPEDILDDARQALRWYPPEHIFLNPDCGFGTFSNSPVNSVEIASRKLTAIVTTAQQLREQFRKDGR